MSPSEWPKAAPAPRKIGNRKPQHHRDEYKRTIVVEHLIAIRQLLRAKPDMTLAELREALAIKCTLPALR